MSIDPNGQNPLFIGLGVLGFMALSSESVNAPEVTDPTIPITSEGEALAAGVGAVVAIVSWPFRLIESLFAGGEAATAGIGASAWGAKCTGCGSGYVGSNVRLGSGRVNSDLTGGIEGARMKFDKLTGGQSRIDPTSGHSVGSNGIRLRMGNDGRARIEIPAQGGRSHETIHFND